MLFIVYVIDGWHNWLFTVPKHFLYYWWLSLEIVGTVDYEQYTKYLIQLILNVSDGWYYWLLILYIFMLLIVDVIDGWHYWLLRYESFMTLITDIDGINI